MHVCMYASALPMLGGPGNSDTLAARTSCVQSLDSKRDPALQGTGALWRNLAASRFGQRKYKLSLEHLFCARKYGSVQKMILTC